MTDLVIALRIQSQLDAAKRDLETFAASMRALRTDSTSAGTAGANAGNAIAGGLVPAQRAAESTADAIARIGTEAQRSLAQLTQSAKQAATATGSVQTSADAVRNSIGLLTQAWIAWQAVVGTVEAAVSFARTADEVSNLDSRVKLATANEREYASAKAALYAQAQALMVPLSATTNLFARLNPVVRDLGGSYRQTMQIAGSAAATLRLSGASAEESASAILQLSQALASGQLAGDEFKSLAENAPRMMRAIADSIGVPVGALKQMAAEGKLTSAVVGNALVEANGKLMAEVATMPPTVSGSMAQIENAYQRWIGASDGASSATQALAGTLRGIAENFGEVVSVVLTGGTAIVALIGGRVTSAIADWVASLVAARAAQVASTAETAKQAIATVAQTQATLRQAEAAAALAVAETAAAEANLRDAAAAAAAGISTQNLAAAQARAAVAAEAQTAATVALSVAQQASALAATESATATAAATAAASTAGTALRGVLGILGGPVGIIVTLGLAAAAWVTFGQKADESATKAANAARRARAELDKTLQKKREMDAGGAAQAQSQSDAQGLKAARGKLASLEAARDQWTNSPQRFIRGLFTDETAEAARYAVQIRKARDEVTNYTNAVRDGAQAQQQELENQQREQKAQRLSDDPNVALDKLRQTVKTQVAIRLEGEQEIAKARSVYDAAIAAAEKKGDKDRVSSLTAERANALKIIQDKTDKALAGSQKRGGGGGEVHAQMKADLQELQQAFRESDALIVQALEQGRKSIQQAYDERSAALHSEIDSERQVLEAELANPKTTGARRIEIQAKLKGLDTELSAGDRKLTEWKRQQEDKLAGLTVKLRIDTANLAGEFDRSAVEQQLRLQYADQLKATQTLSNPAEVIASQQRIELLIQAGVAQAEFNAKLEEAQRLQQQLGAVEQAIQQRVSSGQISQIEGEALLQQARSAQLPMLRNIADELQRVRDAMPPEAAAAIDRMTTSIAGMQNQVAAATPVIVDLGTRVQNSIIDGLADASANAIESWENLRKAASSALKQIAADIIRSDIKRLLTSLFTPDSTGGGNTGSILGAAVSGVKSIFGFSEGGHVRGPGTSTSDSINARLSDGEFVQPTRAVKHYGVGFMEAIRKLQVPKPRFATGGLVAASRAVPRFATGGAVSQASGAETQSAPSTRVEIVNRGSDKRVESATTTMNGKEMIVQVLLADVASNGPITRGMRKGVARR